MKEIRIYNSFEDSESAQFEYWAGLSPEQRLNEFWSLMSRFYEFKKPNWKEEPIIIHK